MRKENKKNKGFSLVELIIVIAIMVILGAIIVMFGIITHNVYKEIKKKDEHSTFL